jgi:uncharacterized iron-regulated membrane protein
VNADARVSRVGNVVRGRGWSRLLRRAHAWTGFVASLLIAAMALSGSLLLFRDDIRRLTVTEAAAAPLTDPVRLGTIANEAQRRFGGDLRFLRFGSEQFGLNEAFLKGGGAYLDNGGQVAAQWSGRRPLDWLVEFHHRLLLDKTGATAIGVIGIAAFGLLVSGLVLWWPMRRAFRMSPIPARNRRPALLASHRDLGALLSPILLLSIVTGVAMALPGMSQPLFGFNRTPPKAAGPALKIDWTRAIPAAAGRMPDAVPRQISFAGDGKAATIRLRRPGEWNRQGLSTVYLSSNGSILGVVDAEAERAGARAYARLFPLHSGQVGWRPLRLLLLAGGIGMALLALLGAEAFRRRLFGSRSGGLPASDALHSEKSRI